MYFRYVLAISLVRMRINGVNSASGLKLPSASYSETMISYIGNKIVALPRLCTLWPSFGIFSLCMRRNSYLGAPGQKSDPATRSGDLDKTDAFPLPSDVYGVYSMILSTTSRDLVTLTLTLTFWPCHRLHTEPLMADHPHTNFDHPTIISYW